MDINKSFIDVICELLLECEKKKSDNCELEIEIGDKKIEIDFTFKIS